MSNQGEPPHRAKGDIAHAVAKAAIGSVPVVGAAGAELFAYLIQEPYQKRREEWMRQVGDDLADLRERAGIDVDKLKDDPAFTDAVLSATQVALRTRSDAKRAALRNIIKNAAKPSAPSEAEQAAFIRVVDELSDWHVALLHLFEAPPKWLAIHDVDVAHIVMGAPSQIVEMAFPQLSGKQALYDSWWLDLHNRGLVSIDSLHVTMTAQGMLTPRLTPLGKRFASFVSDAKAPAG